MKAEGINISFGDVFKSRDPDRQYVIVNVCEATWFDVCEVLSAEDRLGLAGTSYREDILEIVGKMTFEEIIRGIENSIQAPVPEIRKALKVASRKPPRLIY